MTRIAASFTTPLVPHPGCKLGNRLGNRRMPLRHCMCASTMGRAYVTDNVVPANQAAYRVDRASGGRDLERLRASILEPRHRRLHRQPDTRPVCQLDTIGHVLALASLHGTTELEYLFGPDLLVAPIYNAEGNRPVVLPPGTWIDFWSRELVHNPRRDTFGGGIDPFPLYARSRMISLGCWRRHLQLLEQCGGDLCDAPQRLGRIWAYRITRVRWSAMTINCRPRPDVRRPVLL
jgi:Glycosyl hydrolase family 31 C-terminal domain